MSLDLFDHLAKTNQRETRIKRVKSEVVLLSTSVGVFSKRHGAVFHAKSRMADAVVL